MKPRHSDTYRAARRNTARKSGVKWRDLPRTIINKRQVQVDQPRMTALGNEPPRR